MASWVRQSVVIYVGLLFTGTLLAPPFSDRLADAQRLCNSPNPNPRIMPYHPCRGPAAPTRDQRSQEAKPTPRRQAPPTISEIGSA